MSNDTFWPSDKEVIPAASSAVAWTNTSLAPPSGAMKPKPLEELKNLTVPMVMMISLRVMFGRMSEPRKHQVGKCLGQARTRRVGIGASSGAVARELCAFIGNCTRRVASKPGTFLYRTRFHSAVSPKIRFRCERLQPSAAGLFQFAENF